jgi:hypothetical protein
MHLDSAIDRVWRCTERPCSSKYGNTIGDQDGVNSEMRVEAVNECVWTCTWMPRSNDLREALGGSDQTSLDMHWRPRSGQYSDAP